MMPLILLVIQGSQFSVELYTLHRIQHNYPHTDSVCLMILIDESTKISQSVQSRDPLMFLNSISRPLFNSASNGRFPLHQRRISGDKLNNGMVRSSEWREKHRSIGIFNIRAAQVKYTIFPCTTFHDLKIAHDWCFK